ncbi:MAG TPA: nuclear transport factor 2 family protein [Polyangia bacterium]|nr:nuclear transport factor 2 family protein [Polyangia bacterium]
METLTDRARAFVDAVAARAPIDVIASFYAPDVVHEELPNRLLPKGLTRDLQALREANLKGRAVMSAETYQVLTATEQDGRVVLEVAWTGTLAVPFGSLQPGAILRARFAQVFEFKDGLIWRQRNYDCFDAW